MRMPERSKVVLGGLAAVFWLVGWARAAAPQDERTLRVPSILSDGMVLQQQMPIRLWGMAEIGQTVVLELTRSDEAGVCRSGKACADADGKWLIELESMEASFTPLAIRISAGGEQIVIRDVLIGEVWLASGQSNMHLPLQNIIGAEKLLAEAQNGRIRMFCQEHLGKEYFPEPRFDVAEGQWIGGDRPDLLRLSETSGIGYTFALSLFEALNRNGETIPVAVVNAATGATSIHAWLSGAKTHSDPTLEARYPREWVRERQGMSFNQATAQFNHKVAPLANLSIRGFVWSQGENDVGGADAALYYRRALVGLIDDWRDQFRNAKAPFIVAQLAPHVYWDDLSTLAGMRQAQIEACAERNRTAALPIHDLPLTWNVGPFMYKAPVHPLDKMPVGDRMARAARALAYGEAIEYTGPTYAGMKVQGPSILVSFTHCDGGLKIDDGASELKGFTVCGADRVFFPAEARIHGHTVEVVSPLVPDPMAVAYGYTSLNQYANLFNSEGLPASPFRTDNTASVSWHPQHWMECDSEQVWLNTKKDAHWMPAWQPANPKVGEVEFHIDRNRKTQGEGGIRILYTTSGRRLGFSPLLPGTLDLSHFGGMSFDIQNPDRRAMQLSVQLKTAEGTVLMLREALPVPVEPEWRSMTYHFDGPVSGKADAKADVSRISEMTFLLDTEADGKGELLIDQVRFLPRSAPTLKIRP